MVWSNQTRLGVLESVVQFSPNMQEVPSSRRVSGKDDCESRLSSNKRARLWGLHRGHSHPKSETERPKILRLDKLSANRNSFCLQSVCTKSKNTGKEQKQKIYLTSSEFTSYKDNEIIQATKRTHTPLVFLIAIIKTRNALQMLVSPSFMTNFSTVSNS